MKKKLLLVYVLVAFVMLCTNVYAIVNAELKLVAEETAIKPGEDVIVTVELKNLSSAVSSIEGYINIDENVLEEISSNMVVANDNGEIEVKTGNQITNSLNYAFNPSIENADYDVIFNTSDLATNGNDVFFIMDFKKDIENDSEIIKLKYKVKETAKSAQVLNAVKLDCVVAYSADSTDKSEELSANLNIEVSSTVQDSNNDNTNINNTNNSDNNVVDNTTNNTNTENTNTNTNKNTNINTNTNTNNNTNTNSNSSKNTNTNVNSNKAISVTNTVDNTVSGTRIPAAGLKTVIMPIIIFVILAYVSYTKYIAYKDV